MSIDAVETFTVGTKTTIFMNKHTRDSRFAVWEVLASYLWMEILTTLFFAVWEESALSLIKLDSLLVIRNGQKVCFVT